jgi:hypothetical protein
MSTDPATLATELRQALDSTRPPDQPKTNQTFGDLFAAAKTLPPDTTHMPSPAPTLPDGAGFASDFVFLRSLNLQVGFLDQDGNLLTQADDFGNKTFWPSANPEARISLAIEAGCFGGLCINTSSATIVTGPLKYPEARLQDVFEKQTCMRDLGDGNVQRIYQTPIFRQSFPPTVIAWKGYSIESGRPFLAVHNGGWKWLRIPNLQFASLPELLREVLEGGK